MDVKKYEFNETPEIKNKIRKKVELNTKKTYFSFGNWDIDNLLDKFKDLKSKLESVQVIYKNIEEGKLEPLDFDIFQFKNFINEFINKLNEPSDKELINKYENQQ